MADKAETAEVNDMPAGS